MTLRALDDRALAETRTSAWSALGHEPPAGLRQALLRAWSEPQRHYYDLPHCANASRYGRFGAATAYTWAK